LSGAPVAKRWTAAHKEAIRRSRVDAPRALLSELAAQPDRPRAYVSASAIGYYGTSSTRTFDEASPPGDDFLARICVDWEAVAGGAAALGMRVAIVRTALVLGTDGGALKPLLPIFRLGLGGIVASGRQWMSWIHIDDLVGIYLRAVDEWSGAYNASAPNPVTNAEFTATLGTVLRRPTILPVPSFALRAVLGEGATIVLRGQRVLPQRTGASGYVFRYAALDSALRALLG
jgi:uncharacterized protein (TIGR01777 family)